jgi:hypothetical protein
MRNIIRYSSIVLGILALVACKKEDPAPVDESLMVPETYNFENVSFSGQTIRMDMLTELVNYVKTANSGKVALDSAKLFNMFNGSGFTNEALNGTTKNLASKTSAAYLESYKNTLADAAVVSKLDREASKGVSGTLTSTSRTILVNAKGFEYKESVEKNGMATIFIDQAVNYYLANILLDDNKTVVPGEGTAMMHHWDEAYGYFTPSLDFPNATTDKFWSKYATTVNPIIGCNAIIGNAFRTGRAAIVANKTDIVAEQRAIIIKEWQRIAAANVIGYINKAKAGYTDVPVRIHSLTECYGFLLAIQITGVDVSSILTTLDAGLLDISETQLTEFSNTVANKFDLKSVQSSL